MFCGFPVFPGSREFRRQLLFRFFLLSRRERYHASGVVHERSRREAGNGIALLVSVFGVVVIVVVVAVVVVVGVRGGIVFVSLPC